MTKLLYTFLFILSTSVLSFGQKVALEPEKIDIENVIKDAQKGGPVHLPQQEVAYHTAENDLLDIETKNLFPGINSYDLYNRWGEKVGNLITVDGLIYYDIDNEKGNVTSFYPNHKTGGYVIEETTDQYWTCATVEIKDQMPSATRSNIGKYSYGDDLQSFRLAIIVTGEFYEQHGNTDNLVMADIVKTISGVNRIFERDLSLNFNLQGRVKLFSDKDTDPFIPSLNGGSSRSIQSGLAFNDEFMASAYDLGITFNSNSDGWPGGGEAVVEAACNPGSTGSAPTKARIWAASPGEADNGFIALVTHEFGHAFGARHTMNSDSDICGDVISSDYAYEIGGGSTIMSYGGQCGGGDDYVMPREIINNYFHFSSLYMIAQYTKTLSCQDVLTTENTPPDITVNPCNMPVFQVPLSTPFSIRAEGSDDENENLTYVWEQFDEDGTGSPNAGFLGPEASMSSRGPLFRGYAPTANPSRDFPRFFNYFFEDPFETLSKVARDITLRCTIRDNSTEGAFTSDEVIVEVLDVGPLEIEIDSLIDTIVGGETINLTWNDDGISGLCDLVDITLLSLSDPSVIIPVASGVAYADLGLQYFVAPGFSIDGDFHFKVECHSSDCFSFYSYSRPFFASSNNCPVQEPYYTCGLDDITANIGDESLNFITESFTGISTYTQDFLIDDLDEEMPFIRYSLQGDCQGVVFPSGNPVRTNFEFVNFQVSETGLYNFRSVNPIAGMLIFDEATFDASSPCSSLVGSGLSESVNVPGTTTTSFNGNIGFELKACVEYRLGITSFEDGLNYTVTINGETLFNIEKPKVVSGDVFSVVEKENAEIEAILSDADFRSIRQGQKKIYSIKVDGETFVPSDFIGMRLSDLGVAGVCVERSSNTANVLLINPLPDEDLDGFHTDEDCDDTDPNVNPGATEILNNTIDEDCDGIIEGVDVDEDGFNAGFDCDDNDPLINPDAEEIVNNDVDENCDGEITIIDEDMDGFNSDEDCDDLNADTNPGVVEIPNNDVDEDCDGEALIIDEDMDGFNSDDDCDDANPDANPGAEEIPNNDIDENCDGEILVIDADMDGFNSSVDCDDNDPLINPDAEEIASNEVDENCDGIVLNFDADEDGFNSEDDCDDSDASVNPDAEEIANNDVDENCDGVFLMIDEDMDGFNSAIDCNDQDALINPDAVEIPNNDIDENCDGAVVIIDNDMDGFNSSVDCDDENSLVNPEAEEIPNNDVDEDCDGVAIVIDEDMDGFNSDEDCNDLDSLINPAAMEIPNNNVDENCNGEIAYTDEDGDGYTGLLDCNDLDSLINPGATDIPNNGIDEDCDGEDLTSSLEEFVVLGIRIFPNPVESVLTVDMGDKLRSFILQNIQGQIVYRTSEFQGERRFLLGDVPSGLYLINVYDEKNELISSGKLVKI